MKKWALLILMLLSLSWITSLMEGFFCKEAAHETHASVQSEASPEAAEHSCHAGSCHFGHCAHFHGRLASSSLDEPDGRHAAAATPYSFILSRQPLFFLMRPPLTFS